MMAGAAAARWNRPFLIDGMNALFIVALSGLLARMQYAPIRALPIAPQNTCLLYALLFNAFMFSIAWLMWRKQWFVNV
jgi:predicted acyltransferase